MTEDDGSQILVDRNDRKEIEAEEKKLVVLEETATRRRKNRRRGKRKGKGKHGVKQSTKMDGDGEFVPHLTQCEDEATPKQDVSENVSQQALASMSVDDDATSVNEMKVCPWRKHIPEHTVDPISLELLTEISYPPFALVVDKPYTPMYPETWPPSDNSSVDDNEDRELAILKQQWGEGVAVKSEEKDDNILSLSGRNFNLFDGRILAFYLVSTQQYIDPYNRRDLTRGELEALDDYLAFYNLPFAGVCLAYDNRVTISTAGSRAQSAAGRAAARAEILRQNAHSILSEMFTIRKTIAGASTRIKKGRSRDLTAGPEKMKMIDQEAMTSLRPTEVLRDDTGGEFHDRETLESHLRVESPDETGVYGREGGGVLLIDDDINPGLRGKLQVENQAAQQFPSLTTLQGDCFNTMAHKWSSQNSLSRVCESGEVTDPKLSRQQREAKEAERQRQAEEDQTLGRNAVESISIEFIWNNKKTVILPSSQNHRGDVAKLKEKEKKAPLTDYSKLNVLKPMTSEIENTSIPPSVEDGSGWSRPVSGMVNANPAKYVASLIARATTHVAELIKLEEKLINFLADDGKPTLSLKPMASNSLHVLVQDYCQYWNLRTEGFDAAPNITKSRVFQECYIGIGCNKLENTCAPHPLLSEVAKQPVLSVSFKKKKKGKKMSYAMKPICF